MVFATGTVSLCCAKKAAANATAQFYESQVDLLDDKFHLGLASGVAQVEINLLALFKLDRTGTLCQILINGLAVNVILLPIHRKIKEICSSSCRFDLRKGNILLIAAVFLLNRYKSKAIVFAAG